MILAIDPGNVYSAYVIMGEDYKPTEFGKIENYLFEGLISACINHGDVEHVVIEMVASYGMAVGQTVFDTCVWIGRFKENAEYNVVDNSLMFRKDVKMNLCGQTRAKDSNIIQALIDRFAYGVPNRGKGYKKGPGWFYGFKADIWQAYALGVTYMDERKNNVNL